MQGVNLSKNVVVSCIKPDASGYDVVAGATDVVSDIIDTAGYEGVMIITAFGVITSGAATSQKLEDGADSAMADTADMLGSHVTITDTQDGLIAVYDVYRPAKRYLTVTTKRATQNAVIKSMAVIKYGARKFPVTADATVIGTNVLVSVIDGTA